MSINPITHDSAIIRHCQQWIKTLVIGENLCPFAKAVFIQEKIHYQIDHNTATADRLEALISECQRLDSQATLETTLFICPQGLSDFDDFLDLLAIAEPLLKAQGYEGIYQLASFHPHYHFANTQSDAAENYTNRSPYPILHLLRESSIEKALLHYSDPEAIVEHNIALMNRLGTPHLQQLFNSFTHDTNASL
ncbi:MAG TPA: DUF1415 domain-containing protein [Methylococcaceae bacterium]|jgi:hypothetical protein|nr:DUF1415 domain-containing protein [Methylococcaceae bacterium]HIN67858.1 DUF1415 domain-containing protein [Methylococcales bacterium]HIA46080.1 DUF1415 domain-containing protein [Methylococcaceae bacterium]HIB63182.1 DUF1415 domain-containing protein [Methylococcaceae bacterium]HIO13331.1 DUF1415 domain-containing protein [Methylococcales bacterium]